MPGLLILNAITLIIAVVVVLVIDSQHVHMFMFQTAALVARRDLYQKSRRTSRCEMNTEHSSMVLGRRESQASRRATAAGTSAIESARAARKGVTLGPLNDQGKGIIDYVDGLSLHDGPDGLNGTDHLTGFLHDHDQVMCRNHLPSADSVCVLAIFNINVDCYTLLILTFDSRCARYCFEILPRVCRLPRAP